MQGVVLHLFGTTTFGLADGFFHRLGHAVGVQNSSTTDVAGCAANGLDQTALRAQKAFFVSVQDGDKRDLRQIDTFAQQVDADQHIESAQTQVAQDFNALHGVDVAV